MFFKNIDWDVFFYNFFFFFWVKMVGEAAMSQFLRKQNHGLELKLVFSMEKNWINKEWKIIIFKWNRHREGDVGVCA